MEKHHQSNKWLSHSDLPNIQESTGNSRFSNFVEQANTLNTFHFIASLCQIFLGLSVITVSILGLFDRLWISLFLTLVASATTMIGLYFLYITVSRTKGSNLLLREAMKRVMKSKN